MLLKDNPFDNVVPQILIEGAAGMEFRQMGTQELLQADPGPEIIRRRQVREKLAERRSRNEKGYQWSMGYNMCCGRYTGGEEFSRFGGSSLNRRKKEQRYDKDFSAAAGNFVEMAQALPVDRRGNGWRISRTQCPAFFGPDCRGRAKYWQWILASGSCKAVRIVDRSAYGLHVLSPRSRGKIKDKATAFFRSSAGNRVFCTLTFVAAVSDAVAVAVLNKFLTALRADFANLQFLWVIERQNENVKYPGNPHFHMILNRRLPVDRYNALWVLQQYNAGLVGDNKYDEPISKAEILERYKDGTIAKVLNPLTVKKVKSIGGLSMYLTKYITKQEKNVPFGCAVWHCSRTVSRMFTRSVVGHAAVRSCLGINNVKVDMNTGECWRPDLIKKPFYIMVYINNKSIALPYLKEMEVINRWILNGMLPDKVPILDDELYRKFFVNPELN
jgi:hypothetical protein